MLYRPLSDFIAGKDSDVVRVDYIREWALKLKTELLLHKPEISIHDLQELLNERVGKKILDFDYQQNKNNVSNNANQKLPTLKETDDTGSVDELDDVNCVEDEHGK